MIWTCEDKRGIDVKGKRKKGRPKERLLNSVRADLIEKGLSGRKCTWR